jgi:hypothetical protein
MMSQPPVLAESSEFQSALRAVVVLMAIAAAVWLSYELYRLVWQPEKIGFYTVHPGAIDLELRFHEVRGWFAGQAVYQEMKGALYPPASYAMLWPLLGWIGHEHVAASWAFTSVLALAWLVWLVVRESGAETRLERVFVALMPLSAYATGATIGNGQLVVHLLPAMLASLLMLRSDGLSWAKELLAALLFVVSLTKPQLSAPFFWIFVFYPGRLRPAALVAGLYLLLTWLASLAQPVGAVQLFADWVGQIRSISSTAEVAWSNYNAQSVLLIAGWGESSLLFSLLMLLGMGLWVYVHRNRDIWLLLGALGYGTHFFTYHLWYDDLVIVPAMIALFRIAKSAPVGGGRVAGGILACTLPFMVAPGAHFLLPQPWVEVYMLCQSAVWTAGLAFLMAHAHRHAGRPK